MPPSWLISSISAKPGTASLQSAHVRSGICDFTKIPGLVRYRTRDSSLFRPAASRRLIVAALIRTNRAACAPARWRDNPRVESMRGD